MEAENGENSRKYISEEIIPEKLAELKKGFSKCTMSTSQHKDKSSPRETMTKLENIKGKTLQERKDRLLRE